MGQALSIVNTNIIIYKTITTKQDYKSVCEIFDLVTKIEWAPKSDWAGMKGWLAGEQRKNGTGEKGAY